MDHITVPKVRRRNRRGWESGIPSPCSSSSPGTPSQPLGCSLTPSSARDQSNNPRSHPVSPKLNFLLLGSCLQAAAARKGEVVLYQPFSHLTPPQLWVVACRFPLCSVSDPSSSWLRSGYLIHPFTPAFYTDLLHL